MAWLQDQVWLCFIPILLLLLVTATDFLILTHVTDTANSLFFGELPKQIDDARRDAAEALKARTLQYLYFFLFLVCLLHWRKIVGYFSQWPHLVLIVAYLLLGYFYSIDPTKVITNTVLILIGFLTAVLFASGYAGDRRYDVFYQAVFWPMLIIHASSLFVLSLYDVNIIDFLFSSQRYGGLAGNPNSLGSTAVLGVWAGTGILLSTRCSPALRVLAFIGVSLFCFNTALTGSGTSTVAIILVLLALVWLKVLSLFRPRIRLVVNGSLVLIVFFGFMYAIVVSTPADMYLGIIGSMGKDATLTGRTELWAIAREAISLKPVTGWGLDSHQSVMAERAFAVRYNHYHNGFLDTMIAGGVILLALVLYNLFRFILVFLQTFRNDARVFPLLLPFIILVVLNLSEYSLLRPNSQLWLVYVTAFTMLTFDPEDSLSLRFKPGSWRRRSKGRKRRGGKLRWA